MEYFFCREKKMNPPVKLSFRLNGFMGFKQVCQELTIVLDFRIITIFGN